MTDRELLVVEQKKEVLKSWDRCMLNTVQGDQYWVIDDENRPFTSKELKKFQPGKAGKHSSDLLYRRRSATAEGDIACPEWTEKSYNFRNSTAQSACRSASRGLNYFSALQTQDGNWAGDYGGPMFLLPSLVITSYVTESPFPVTSRQLMQQYMLNHQGADGGWGIHLEGESTMFGTVLQYVALRLLGTDAGEDSMLKARNWIGQNGGAEKVPSWGKFFLAVLGVIDWKGCNSLAPEMWLLPKSLPIHPGRYWCHSRMVYLPMSYCYGVRLQGEITSIVREIRAEILSKPFEQQDWTNIRFEVAEKDRFHPVHPATRILYGFMNAYESVCVGSLRRKSLEFVLEYVRAEDDQTSFIDIGPVNQIINSLVIWHADGRNSETFQKHRERWKYYLWIAEDGMKMNGYNGSQLWDTAFAVQAYTENKNLVFSETPTLLDAYSYLDSTQILEEIKDRQVYFRHPSKGGWPFSTRAHGWPISDCTAEGLKATLAIHKTGIIEDEEKISPERLEAAADLILSFQNKDGGWATYENTRSSAFIEILNPSEVFGKIMIDYSWVECTSACITALIDFQQEAPDYKAESIRKSILRGIEFLLDQQRKDGSWIGSWGICFTYGTWFAIEALTKATKSGYGNHWSSQVEKACEFLLSHQREDGGWGESYRSCVQGQYVEHENSQVINTSWALLALMSADSKRCAVQKGIDYLLRKQKPDGDWPQQGISGVFNQNCMITYASYRNIFPLWALGRYQNL